jgi:hypothetical protein
MKKINSWFTLIELIVWITIFSVIFITMMSIYILSSDTSLKSDINRAMHENLKSIVTEISEDIIKNNISWVSTNVIDINCNLPSWPWNFKKWTKLCINSNSYFLAKKDWDSYIRVENNYCKDFWKQCYIVKNGVPLSNSLVSVKNLDFYITNTLSKKVTINIKLQPTTKAWVKPNLIKENILFFQTTISERPF